ncbi:MAG: replication protein [Clostridia bacterium]|nr:replication protein [Clostridia bacterium]
MYLDSAPSDWLDRLEDLQVPCFVSPYHDRDFSADGEPKKPHYHIMFNFSGKKSVDSVKKMVDVIGGVGIKFLDDVRGSARYLCHLDNPEKALYKATDVKSFGGLDYFECCNTVMDRYNALLEMKDYCIKNNILHFAQLFEYASDNEFSWFRILCDSGAYIMDKFISSRRFIANNCSTEHLPKEPRISCCLDQKAFDELDSALKG